MELNIRDRSFAHESRLSRSMMDVLDNQRGLFLVALGVADEDGPDDLLVVEE